jgi:hypothetical protein
MILWLAGAHAARVDEGAAVAHGIGVPLKPVADVLGLRLHAWRLPDRSLCGQLGCRRRPIRLSAY